MANEIKGLKVIYDFITPDEENEILLHAETVPMATKRGGRSSIKRWGNGKCYDNFIVSDKIPEWLGKIAQKLIDNSLLDEMPTEISFNMYDIGDYIAPHIDNEKSGSIITVLSLFGKADIELTKDNEKLVIPLPPRTLIQLSGDMRFLWRHSIPPVSELRYSLVFRKNETI